jgi:DNA helicase-2/ATP-dependent DNA helicase PcrA
MEGHRLGFPSNFTIYDTQDSERLIREIIKEMNLDKDVYKSKQILGRISSFKNSLITTKVYFNTPELIEADQAAMRPQTGAIYQEYVNRCFKAGAMDFDDLLLRTNELLSVFPEVLAQYQDRFRYILVDEYQDTNHSQYLIVKALAARFENICVVGDDAQSIYAFRGANVQNILNLRKDYPNLKMFKLEQNYRSTSNIVEAANNVISNNKGQIKKDVWTSNDNGDKIEIIRALTDSEEGKRVASKIFENAMSKQEDWSSFAILYRTNMQSRAMEDALRRKDIPYRIYGGLSFYQRKEIKDVLAYFRLLLNKNDEEALRRVINYPMRGIGQTTFDRLILASKKYDKSIFEIMENILNLDTGINRGTARKIENFVILIQSLQVQLLSNDAFEVAEAVVKSTGMVKSLQDDKTPEGVSRYENLQELVNSIKDFTDKANQESSDASLAVFMEDVALLTDADTQDDNDNNKVSLMTVHAAKGLEFPHVFIVGVEEDLFPSSMSVNTREDLEEERRLFYVALTRAESHAYISYTQSRYRWGKLIEAEPSRFIEEIGDEFLSMSPSSFRKSASGPQIDPSIFGNSPKGVRRPPMRSKKTAPNSNGNLKPIAESTKKTGISKSNSNDESSNPMPNLFDGELSKGNVVKHDRFGLGEVLMIEGVGSSKKATIKFKVAGMKKILLKFAKLQIIS